MARTAHHRIALGLSAVALLASHGAHAQASFTSQSRSVSATSHSDGALWDESQNPFFPDFDPPAMTFFDDASDDEAAADYTDFDPSASTVDPPLLIIAPGGSSDATQSSSLTPLRIDASGSFSQIGHSRLLTEQEIALANGFLNPPIPYWSGLIGDFGTASSSFAVSFDLAQATPYDLNADLALSGGVRIDFFEGFEITSGSVELVLTGPSGVVAHALVGAFDDCPPAAPCNPVADGVALSGVLVPGAYTLSVDLEGSALGLCTEVLLFECHSPTADGSFDVSLRLGAAAPALPPGGLFALAVCVASLGAIAPRRASGAAVQASASDMPSSL